MGYKNGPIFFFPGVLPPDPQGGLSMSTTAWAYQSKFSFYGLSLKKSSIKKL